MEKFKIITNPDDPDAQKIADKLQAMLASPSFRFPDHGATICFVVGGDGFMVDTLRDHADENMLFYGVHTHDPEGGFLTNEFNEKSFEADLAHLEEIKVYPLKVAAKDKAGHVVAETVAFNEFYFFRASSQALRIRISVDNICRVEQMVADGVLVATPAGSTAYNYSAHGPIIPIEAEMISLTPLAAFRPRRWGGAILPFGTVIDLELQDVDYRPAMAVVDNIELDHGQVASVTITTDKERPARLLFKNKNNLARKIADEQFRF